MYDFYPLSVSSHKIAFKVKIVSKYLWAELYMPYLSPYGSTLALISLQYYFDVLILSKGFCSISTSFWMILACYLEKRLQLFFILTIVMTDSNLCLHVCRVFLPHSNNTTIDFRGVIHVKDRRVRDFHNFLTVNLTTSCSMISSLFQCIWGSLFYFFMLLQMFMNMYVLWVHFQE